MILVTGVSGFIGRRFAQISSRDEKILGLDLNESGSQERIHYKAVNIRDPESIESIGKEYDVASIVHSAAIISPDRCTLEPKLAYETNIIGTLNMLDFARRRDIKKFIYISTGGIYKNSEPEDIVREDWPLDPTDIYDISKATSENTVGYFSKSYGIEAAVLRITAPYGPGMFELSREREIPDSLNRHALIFALKCAKHQDIIMPFGGDHTVNYTYVDDIVSGIMSAIKTNFRGFETFNITGGRNYKISDLGKAANELCPQIKVKIGPGNLLHSREERDPMLTKLSIQQGRFDISKASNLIGYNPKFSLKDGLAELVESFRRKISN